ncbi:HAMP domain-containing protein [Roseateles sp. DAIF2]|uniref:methyl-accepting chemotaxis protein n=1 Tax=Roseateles sp. DAIF2 TaxID=2714952 RepID=UPI0018A30568|nr:methyl-accepting chemotaxis protein [Roseateles sp. DAIF2]QPF75714.1 HAMP domain-containing protein [Roseateles sp. DAIF2]
MKSLSIAAKLWLPVASLAAMVVLMTLASATRTAKLQAEAQQTQAAQQRKFELSLRWRGLTETNAARAAAGILSSDSAVAQTFKPQIESTTASISEMQKELEALATSEEEKAAMARIADTRKAYIATRNEASKLKADGQAEASAALLQGKMLPAIATYLDAQADFVKLQQQRSDALREQAGAERMRTVWIVALVMGLIVAGLAIATFYLVRSIAGPLRELVGQAERIGQGDLREEARGPGDTARADEIGEVQRALAGMRAALARALSEVRHSADSIQTASAEIATGNADLSQRTEQTASNLQQTASSMSELTGTVRQSADAASTANQLASSAAQVAQRGGAVVGQVVSTMDEINSSSKKIADIIGTIDGIAFQTNILALNAAVEAARAGEQGRGFAVVAGEVRSLAQRSAEAAREIKGLIGSSVEKVETGARLVQDAGSTMDEIVASVKRVTDIIAEISASTVEQSQGIGTVNSAVSQLDQMTQQNAALVEQSAAAAESLKDQAGRLAQVVGGFRLG